MVLGPNHQATVKIHNFQFHEEDSCYAFFAFRLQGSNMVIVMLQLAA